MSAESPKVGVAEEALNDKLDNMKIVDDESQDKEEAQRPPRVRLTDEERRALWLEKQALKPVVETGITGKVKWYSIRNHYGFIARDDGGKDVFVHQTAIEKSPINRFFLRTLDDDEPVQFDVVDGDKGPEAANVSGPDGTEVKGSKYFRILLHSRRRPADKETAKKSGGRRRGESEAADGDSKPEKRRRNRVRPPRRRRHSTKKEGGEGKEEGAEVEARPARRRSVPDSGEGKPSTRREKSQTKVSGSPKGAGDASLGGTTAPAAAVH